MSGLKAIKFGLGCLRMMNSPDSNYEINKLAPLARETGEVNDK